MDYKDFLQKLFVIYVALSIFQACDKVEYRPYAREIVNGTDYFVQLDVDADGSIDYEIPVADTLYLEGTCGSGPNGICEVGWYGNTSVYIYFDSLRVLRRGVSECNKRPSLRCLGTDPSANFPGWEDVSPAGSDRTVVRFIIGEEDFEDGEEL